MEASLKGMIGTVDLLALTSLDLLLFIFFIFYKTTYLNEEVNGSEPSPSISALCSSAEVEHSPHFRKVQGSSLVVALAPEERKS